MASKAIKLHAVGMDDRACNALSFFLQKFCNERSKLSEEKKAQVFLVNMDHIDGEKERARLRKLYPYHPIILTSLHPITNDEDYFLRKPMIADHLLVIIDKIEQVSSKKKESIFQQIKTKKDKQEKSKDSKDKDKQDKAKDKDKDKDKDKKSKDKGVSKEIEVQEVDPQAKSTGRAAQLLNEKELTAFVGEAADVNLRQVQADSAIFFDPTHYFLGYLQQACQRAKQEQVTIRITGLWRPITIFPDNNEIYVDLSERQLQSICVMLLDESQNLLNVKDILISPIEHSLASEQCSDRECFHNLDSLMWKVALWTSRGRLPVGIPLDTPVFLEAWPNLTRLIVTPYALRIAACWVPFPRTLINITEMLEIPQRYVFSFFTACYVIGLSGVGHRELDALILPSKIEPTKKRGFFSRMLKKLQKEI